MVESTRRTLLRAGAAAAVSGPAAALAASWHATAQAAPQLGGVPAFGSVTVGPDDPRYRSLALRGYNHRFHGEPEQIRVVGSTEDVVRAVDEAVRTGRRIAVRSGGHCFEDFVDGPDVRVLIDMVAMTRVDYDRRRNAFMVEAGATLGEVYRELFLGWGVTIPGGTCPSVGAGGHVCGGGYGALCRMYGLTVDHLFAVEVVVVDRSGKARSVVATREPSDPNRDLWWAHTGGGGGNFGIVTRYWFRSPDAQGTDPGRLLPRPPSTVLSYSLDWPWAELDRDSFVRLMRNYGEWGERNSAPGSPAAALYGEFALAGKSSETIGISGQVAADSGAERLLGDLVRTLGRGVGARPVRQSSTLPWLASATQAINDPTPFDRRLKLKSGYRRRRLTDQQIATAYRYLTGADHNDPNGHLFINTYGGRVNAVSPGTTAMPHRDSIFLVGFLAGWQNAAEDSRHLTWIRELYRDFYAAGGGVPAGEDDDGAFINYADADLADPRYNTSAAPWHSLYYKDDYVRLQQVKRRWDPRDVFHHALSIRPS
ncbi:FAD-binding oxidoreductase [Actinoallomurus sp. CA-150999]|uniref:FAD-binding oxidoreductase n=1 Tax=Actinoallomurus sp. CA-150999 TaxID=3239887 RepID=UPI003D9282AA